MTLVLVVLFVVTQLLYSAAFLVDLYLLRLPVNRVDLSKGDSLAPGDYPPIIMLYPVLREREAVMRTTFIALSELEYPSGLLRAVAIPNYDDLKTVASLRRLQAEFPFLELMEVPPTSHCSWQRVWDAWNGNPNAYWWHEGYRSGVRDLPPKKTRQLIYAFYALAENGATEGDFLLNYIDADSCPPTDHLIAGAVGMRDYDVIQASNIAGNLNDTLAASWHAFDHMAWDGRKYQHLTADGRQPFWVLGKGLFLRASDLLRLGGFHPWLTIEDPELGLRFWADGKRLGYIENPLIEEVPTTFSDGITQRKRWVCGFFQTLDEPLRRLVPSRRDRLRAWCIFLPCLSQAINIIGLPVGVWALWRFIIGTGVLPNWTIAHATVNLLALALSWGSLYRSIWSRTELVLERRRDRLKYLIRCNPLALLFWSVLWCVPLWIGWRMYRKDEGLVWVRTEKIDANAGLVRSRFLQSANAG